MQPKKKDSLPTKTTRPGQPASGERAARRELPPHNSGRDGSRLSKSWCVLRPVDVGGRSGEWATIGICQVARARHSWGDGRVRLRSSEPPEAHNRRKGCRRLALKDARALALQVVLEPRCVYEYDVAGQTKRPICSPLTVARTSLGGRLGTALAGSVPNTRSCEHARHLNLLRHEYRRVLQDQHRPAALITPGRARSPSQTTPVLRALRHM